MSAWRRPHSTYLTQHWDPGIHISEAQRFETWGVRWAKLWDFGWRFGQRGWWNDLVVLWCEINSLLSTKSIYTKPLLKFKGLSWKTSSNFTVEIVFKGNITWHLIPFGSSTWPKWRIYWEKGVPLACFVSLPETISPIAFPIIIPIFIPMILPQWLYRNDVLINLRENLLVGISTFWFRSSKGGHQGNHHLTIIQRGFAVLISLGRNSHLKNFPSGKIT